MAELSTPSSPPETLHFAPSGTFPPAAGSWRRAPDGTLVVGCPKCDAHPALCAPPFEVQVDGRVLPSFGCPKCGYIAPAQLDGFKDELGKCPTCGHAHPGARCPECSCLSGAPGWAPGSALPPRETQVPISIGVQRELVILVVGDVALPMAAASARQLAEGLMKAAAQADRPQIAVVQRIPDSPGLLAGPGGPLAGPGLFKRRG